MNHRILIAGYGVSGQGAARLAAYLNLNYDILDEHDNDSLRNAAAQLSTPPHHCFLNWQGDSLSEHYDMVVLSPGIRRGTPLYHTLDKASDTMLSELSFAQRYGNIPMIGITGTNGKTTTTELTTALLNAIGFRAAASGNIGASLSDGVIEAMKGNLDVLVVETSSFQLENGEPFTPAAAAVLNLASDHLDRHGTMEEYGRIKFSIFGSLKNRIVLNTNLASYRNQFLDKRAETVTFSAFDSTGDFALTDGCLTFHGSPILAVDSLALKGRHNLENCMAALALAAAYAGKDVLSDPRIINAMQSFRPDLHRNELFLEKDGIRYVNDSKATNPHAVNASLETFGTSRNILILLGGLDKGMDFTELKDNAGKIKTAFLFGRCGQTIFDALKDVFPCVPCHSFESAVEQAVRHAGPGDVVLLSPATASMDLFRNYRERGDRFKKLVLELINSNQANTH